MGKLYIESCFRCELFYLPEECNCDECDEPNFEKTFLMFKLEPNGNLETSIDYYGNKYYSEELFECLEGEKTKH